tara:strand:+ start:1167 stop:1898 length:732 start_codon:yes stop_codon:yes gene_type:complete
MRYIKTFEQFLNEATFPGRAWEGKLDNIANLFDYMYSKDILTKKEKKIKDRVFRAYYRFYNDGDFPRGIANKYGVTKYDSPKAITTALEQYLEDFMKQVLSKYSTKINRTDYRLSSLLSELRTLRNVITDYEASALLRYWSKKTTVHDSRFGELLIDLERSYRVWEDSADKDIDKWLESNEEVWAGLSKNLIPLAKREKMEAENVWQPKHKKLWDNFTSIMDEMVKVIDEVIKVATDAKSEIE